MGRVFAGIVFKAEFCQEKGRHLPDASSFLSRVGGISFVGLFLYGWESSSG